MNYAMFDMGQTGVFVAMGVMLAVGAVVGMLAFDLDYLTGLLHFGMYLGCCLICRMLSGAGAVPAGSGQPAYNPRGESALLESLELLGQLFV